MEDFFQILIVEDTEYIALKDLSDNIKYTINVLQI